MATFTANSIDLGSGAKLQANLLDLGNDVKFQSVSGGFLSDAPSGTPIQVVHATQSSQITTTATSDQLLLEGTITPKGVNSQILVLGNVNHYSNAGNTQNWTNSFWCSLHQKTSGGSYSKVAQFEHPGVRNDIHELCIVCPITYYSATVTQGTQYYYAYYVKNVSSGDTHYYGRSTDSSTQQQNGAKMTLMEIASYT
tara:strand:- start:67 stop:657 length:591 start_codon:yes stop_codon:yes gene_type:complete